MSVKKILSSDNAFIKKIAKLNTRKYREAFGLFLTEGERAAIEAAQSGFLIESIIMTEQYFDAHPDAFLSHERIVTTDKIFATLCDTKTPQGVMAVCKIPEAKALFKKRYVYCDKVQDPGNAGTIIRTADAFGFDGVIFSSGSVDVYSPKVIRSTMGSVFHIDVLTDGTKEMLLSAKESGYFISATALTGASRVSTNMTKRDKQIYIVGNEANGVSQEILDIADETVYIKMPGSAESLNVGVAASVLMYEVVRHE